MSRNLVVIPISSPSACVDSEQLGKKGCAAAASTWFCFFLLEVQQVLHTAPRAEGVSGVTQSGRKREAIGQLIPSSSLSNLCVLFL